MLTIVVAHEQSGSVKSQDTFHAAYPDKQIYFTGKQFYNNV
jgi:hypothetical protein